jgi:O-antigen/teichoic acid export membrane protein
VGSFLNACNRQKINTINMTIAVCINVILNLLLVKQFTINGAAAAALISGITLFVLGLRQVGKIITYNKKFLIITLAKAAIAAGTMAIALFIIKHLINISIYLSGSAILKAISVFASLGIYIAIGAIIYTIVLLAIKGFTVQDIQFLYKKLVRRST